MSHGSARTISALLLGAVGSIGSLSAQEVWLGSGTASNVSFEVVRPDVKLFGLNQSFASVAVFATGRFRLGERTTLVVELPFAHGSFTSSVFGGSMTESGNTVGDPYIGIEGGRDGSRTFGELGARIPLTSSTDMAPGLVGLAADLERMEAFAPRVATISAFGNYRVLEPNGFTFRLRAGPLAWIATEQNVLRHVEGFMAYAVQAGYRSPSFTFLGGIGGRAILTEDVPNRFTDQLVLSASYRLGGVRPGISVRLPIDNNRDQLVGSAIGVSLTVPLR